MKKMFITVFALMALLLISTSVFAAQTQLYALDGRTLLVEESQVPLYTAEGMGWFLEKPVTMYAPDGRTLVVPADRVEAHKAVGWFVKEDQSTTPVLPPEQAPAPTPQQPAEPAVTPETIVVVRYTDGSIVKVPLGHVATYKTLGWEHIYVEFNQLGNVIIYNLEGDSKEVTFEDAEKFTKSGWLFIKPGTQPAPLPELPDEKVTLFHHSGVTKEVNSSEVSSYKSRGYGSTVDEAIYNYAASGDGGEKVGAIALLQNKKYELAFREVKDALDKIEANNSEYVQKLYTLRSNIIDTWGAAANSPLGFINYWFDTRDGKKYIIFEYRNLGNKRITYLGVNFDICDKDGKVIETNAGSYFVNNLQMLPCDKARVGWVVKSGEDALSITNLKVKEVHYADNTVWKAEE